MEYHVKKCDVVVPLVAIANPAQYVTHPLRVFELDFEANIDIVRHCVKYSKRLIFPSTSEIYGMSPDAVLDEETARSIYGPINKQRWIYAASKQLLDRVIYAYGVRDNLDYTLFRPFNFIGPNLDNVEEPKEGSSRVFTQFLSNVLYRRPIKLVDGGSQKRSFTYIDDAIEALLTHPREQGRLRQPPHLQHRQSRTTASRSASWRERTIRIAQEFPVLRESGQGHRRSSTSPPGSTTASTTRTSRCACRTSRPRGATWAGSRPPTWTPRSASTIAFYVNQEGFGTRAAAMAGI